MRRRTFVLGCATAAASMAAACAPGLPEAPPERVVERLYDPYFGRAESQRLENAAPWTDDMRNMIMSADRRARATNTGWISINPFFGSDNVRLGELAVTAEGPPADGRVRVIARFTNNGVPSRVVWHLVAVKGEWRVENLTGEGWNLRDSVAVALTR